MASGPLVFIHPVLDERGGNSGGSVTQHSSTAGSPPSPKSNEVGMVLSRLGDDLFYWNAASTRTPSHNHITQSPHRPQYHQTRQQQQTTASSAWELSVNHLTADRWINSPRGHSDPNLQEKTSGCFSKELAFNNCMFNSSADSSSAICPPSCTPTPTSTGTMTLASPRGGGGWMLPWQQQRPSAHLQTRQQGLNNEENFFNTASSYQNYVGFDGTATKIVNNHGGFFPNATTHPSIPLQPQAHPSTMVNSQVPTVLASHRQISSESQCVCGESDVGVGGAPLSITACLPKKGGGSNGSPSSSTGGGGGGGNRILQSTNSIQSATVFSKRGIGTISPLNRRISATECVNKPVRPSSDTNVISQTDNPGTPMLKMDSTLSLDADSRTRPCCFCWCCCCSCSCVRVRPLMETGKRSTHSTEEPHRPDAQLLEPRTSYEEVLSWSESFDNLMRCFTSPDGAVGQKAFREFLRSEYSEENILFWLACEDLKVETYSKAVEEKARLIYEDYISILSPKEVSLDSHVREVINTNMTQPTSHTFDEAQLQIYTLMQRDSYPRFLNSRIYKDLLAMTKGENS
nr:Regulator of G protein signaling 20 [Hymenolepis microstoma]